MGRTTMKEHVQTITEMLDDIIAGAKKMEGMARETGPVYSINPAQVIQEKAKLARSELSSLIIEML